MEHHSFAIDMRDGHILYFDGITLDGVTYEGASLSQDLFGSSWYIDQYEREPVHIEIRENNMHKVVDIIIHERVEKTLKINEIEGLGTLYEEIENNNEYNE